MTAQVRSFLYLQPRDGYRDAVVAFYREHRIIELAVERGLCCHGELVIPDDPDARLLVTCTWPSREAYAEWVENRPRGAEGLAEMLVLPEGGLPPGLLAEIAISTTSIDH
ncbi:hypothetical protein ACFC1I_15500 [Microbacterium sp. NPDC056044]|uniref:hypothetical protein n=1 Tax=Microbacterium sp. NPDC056044 TaxID=3345690 RepID=UPI0035DBA109